MIWSVENELNFINARNLGPARRVGAGPDAGLGGGSEGRPDAADDGRRRRRHASPDAARPRRPLQRPSRSGTTRNWPTKPTRTSRDWTWDQQRPKFIGEELFAAGINPAYAYFGGEAGVPGQDRQPAGRGQGDAGDLAGLPLVRHRRLRFLPAAAPTPTARNTTAGRRAPCWCGSGTLPSPPARRPNAPSASSTTRDSPTRSRSPGRWSLDGQQVATQTTQHKIPPGENEKFDREIADAPGRPAAGGRAGR